MIVSPAAARLLLLARGGPSLGLGDASDLLDPALDLLPLLSPQLAPHEVPVLKHTRTVKK